MKRPSRVFVLLLAVWLLAACQPVTPTEPPAPTAPPTPAPPTATPVPAGPWWNDAVFYEVFVRSFQDSDADGIGDINGLIQKLDYLNDGDPATTTDLGVTGIWLMPIMPSPSYHGYDVLDYYDVNEQYGTKEDFTRLIDEAHQRGIRVIIDFVINHSGLGHPWFEQSAAGDPKYRDWYIWADPAPTWRGPEGQPVWHALNDAYYYGIFWRGMPDLNLSNPDVTAELHQVARFWLEEMNVDGFRVDAMKYLIEAGQVLQNTPATHAWLKDFHQFYKSIDPQAIVVGEAWTETSAAAAYVGDEADLVFEFDLAGAFVRAAGGPIANATLDQLEKVLAHYPPGQYGTFLTNHDQNRVMTVLKSVPRAKLAAAMLLTAPGVPFIYYGEEIGQTGAKPDEDIRRPMQWTSDNARVGFTTGTPWRPAAPDYRDASVAGQTDDPDSLLSLYRQLIRLRLDHAALRTGETLVVEADTARLYAVLRYDDEEAFLVLVNVHSTPLRPDLYSLSLEQGPFSGPLTAATVIGGSNPALASPTAPEVNAQGGFSAYQPFTEIPAETAVIIRLAP